MQFMKADHWSEGREDNLVHLPFIAVRMEQGMAFSTKGRELVASLVISLRVFSRPSKVSQPAGNIRDTAEAVNGRHIVASQEGSEADLQNSCTYSMFPPDKVAMHCCASLVPFIMTLNVQSTHQRQSMKDRMC